MPSEPSHGGISRAGAVWAFLSSQQLGILCGLSTVLLLAVGSIVLTVTREGASANVAMDDLRVFFREPSAAHLWLYLLFLVLALYGLNTLLGTWQSVSQKWRLGLRAPHAYAPAIVHAAFVFGLLAHLVGGFAGRDLGQVLVGPNWTDLGNERQARVLELQEEQHPDGSTKQVRATIESRSGAQEVERTVLHYNGPLSSGFGTDLFLLLRAGQIRAARLTRGETDCVVSPNQICRLGNLEVTVSHLQAGPGNQGSLAHVQLRFPTTGVGQNVWIVQDRPHPLGDGSLLTFTGLEAGPAVLLRHRYAPGNRWALLASVLLVAGLFLMWRRFLPISQDR